MIAARGAPLSSLKALWYLLFWTQCLKRLFNFKQVHRLGTSYQTLPFSRTPYACQNSRIFLSYIHSINRNTGSVDYILGLHWFCVYNSRLSVTAHSHFSTYLLDHVFLIKAVACKSIQKSITNSRLLAIDLSPSNLWISLPKFKLHPSI